MAGHRSRGAAVSRRAPLGLASLVIALAVACGDPPPAADVAPVEIVLDKCLLNRKMIAVGTHEVSVVGEGAATITGPGGGDPVVTAEPFSSTQWEVSTPGDYVVNCRSEGKQTSSTLEVTEG